MNPLPLAARKRQDRLAAERHAQPLQEIAAAPPRIEGGATEGARQRRVGDHVKLGDEVEILEDEADAVPL